MSFEIFTETRKSYVPRASISRFGHIGLTGGASRVFGLMNFTHALLFYDKEREMIGIKPTSDDTLDGAVKLRQNAEGFGIAARSFLQYHQISPAITTLYPLGSTNDKEHGRLLTIDLGKGVPRGQGASRGRKLYGSTPIHQQHLRPFSEDS